MEIKSLEFIGWAFLFGVCRILSEFEIWGKGNDWWMSETPNNWFHKITFQHFRDSYHTFRNWPKLLVGIRLIWYDPYISLGYFCAYFVAWIVTLKIIRR